ncbi:hypothetical protein BD626DRAFT_437630 [Schizophyllum amplum]|uniref:Uncharacterized protein n=1 Tax=Schizophyllum amplum TaxID=97359 RepID=A0A550C228_9AGAR|nr:hypothetical protein BD626DRAFT_437630 [Auriculariopsis ampla]
MPQKAITTLQQAVSVFNLDLQRERFVPSPEVTKAIQDHSSRLQSEVLRLNMIIDDITTVREKLVAQLAVHRSLTSPIHRLFPDILSEIFLRAAERQRDPDSTDMAQTIACVCTTWRRVARATPRLWACVVAASAPELDRYFRLFFPLSLDGPLDIRCRDETLLVDFWSRLSPYAHRWRSLEVLGDLDVLSALGHVRAAHLEDLCINGYGKPVPKMPILSLEAPRLRRLRVYLDALDNDEQLLVLPTSSMLTSLVIGVDCPFPATYVLPLLRRCAATLEHFQIDVSHPYVHEETFRTEPSLEPLIMAALKSIDLRHSACAILYHVTAPDLEDITVMRGADYLVDALAVLTSRRSPSRIRHVQMSIDLHADISIDAAAMVRALEAMDSLETLRITSFPSPDSDMILRRLVCHDDAYPLVPNLREFEFPGRLVLARLFNDVFVSRKEERMVQGRTVAALKQ